jgi:hypothetical protein
MENKKKMSMLKKKIYNFYQKIPYSVNFKDEMPFDRYPIGVRR